MKKVTNISKKTGTIALLIGLLGFAFSYPMQSEDTYPPISHDPCLIENNVFQDGEEIVYKLYYNWNFVWLSAGEVKFKVKDLGDRYHLAAYGHTYASYEWFFKVRDYYDTYIDKETLLPITSIRNIKEGGYKLYDKVEFQQSSRKAISKRGKTKENTKTKEYNLDGCMHDILSIVYFTRNMDFDSYQKGQKFPVKIFMDKESWPLNVKYQGKNAKKNIRKLGKFNTIKFSPEVIAGDVFEQDAEMNIWVSDDGNRIPLLIESPVSVGSVKAVLKSYKGLKYDLSSKL